jgi:hypothetical protein
MSNLDSPDARAAQTAILGGNYLHREIASGLAAGTGWLADWLTG